MTTTPTSQPRPRRGRPPAITRLQIVEAARRMDPETLTIQAVADELGVDRKTLRRHVNDREGLFDMVAISALETNYAALTFTASDDWRDTLRSFAKVTRDGVISMGELAGHVHFRSAAGAQALAPAESTLESLVAAGFDEQTAGRILAFVAEFVWTSGRNASRDVDPQTPELAAALSATDEAQLSVLRHVVASADLFGESQFEFDLQVLIFGLERLLDEASRTQT